MPQAPRDCASHFLHRAAGCHRKDPPGGQALKDLELREVNPPHFRRVMQKHITACLSKNGFAIPPGRGGSLSK
jgi:hypothetical protein